MNKDFALPTENENTLIALSKGSDFLLDIYVDSIIDTLDVHIDSNALPTNLKNLNPLANTFIRNGELCHSRQQDENNEESPIRLCNIIATNIAIDMISNVSHVVMEKTT